MHHILKNSKPLLKQAVGDFTRFYCYFPPPKLLLATAADQRVTCTLPVLNSRSLNDTFLYYNTELGFSPHKVESGTYMGMMFNYMYI